jgi:hypothetical protein
MKKTYAALFINFLLSSTPILADQTSTYPQKFKIPCQKENNYLITTQCKKNNVRESYPQTGIPECNKKQKLILKNGISVELPSKLINVKTKDNKNITIIDRVVSTTGCIQGKTENFIWISSYKGCNACGEWFGLIDESGKIIFNSDKSTQDPIILLKKLGAPENWENQLKDIDF